MEKHTITDPIDVIGPQTAPRLSIAPSYRDHETGALYVHEDLKQVLEPWAVEGHIGPINRTERFGDVTSWVAYVQAFAQPRWTLLTWSEAGLRAVLDHHERSEINPAAPPEPGRCQWIATQPFERSIPWRAWQALADGRARTQRQTIEALEDLAEDIVEPDAATLVGLLRSLRASANATATTELRPDGSSRVQFEKSKSVDGEAVLPAEVVIACQVLKGHTTVGDDGKTAPVRYRLPVRVRVSVDDAAHLTFRFSMPTAERVLEAVFADRVEAARALLGESFALLRATGG